MLNQRKTGKRFGEARNKETNPSPLYIWDQLNFENEDQKVKYMGVNSEDGCSSADRVTRL